MFSRTSDLFSYEKVSCDNFGIYTNTISQFKKISTNAQSKQAVSTPIFKSTNH